MTKGRLHFLATAPVAILSWFLYPVEISIINLVAFLVIWFFGVFMDVDHISGAEYIKRALSGNLKVPDAKEWTNYFHTWQFLIVVIIFSVYMANYLIILSYLVHIFMDSLNRQNLKHPNSPIPTAMVLMLVCLGLERMTYWYSEDGKPDDPNLNLRGYKNSIRRRLKLILGILILGLLLFFIHFYIVSAEILPTLKPNCFIR